MKTILSMLLLITVHSFAQDSTRAVVQPAKPLGKPVTATKQTVVRPELKLSLFGEYEITGYAVLSLNAPSKEALTELIGSTVFLTATSITGSVIDPMTFEIYEVERLKRDDFIYRVFGREMRAPEPDLPESFNVHKTDHENCYGIVEIAAGKIAIPYKGVLLYLSLK